MLKIQRLNMDSSWQLSWGDFSLLIDPWLLGTEIDGFSWFNEQWHATAPLPIKEIAPYQAILVSQPFSDHCHEETLRLLKEVPLLATAKSAKRLGKNFAKKRIQLIPDLLSGSWLTWGEMELACLVSTKKLSAAFDGIVLRRAGELIVYCPHGFELTAAQLKVLRQDKTALLITGFSFFKLPFFLGGVVNPGKTNALSLIEQLNPKKVIHTHDENKPSRGFVKKIATVFYPNITTIQEELKERFVFLGEDYETIILRSMYEITV